MICTKCICTCIMSIYMYLCINMSYCIIIKLMLSHNTHLCLIGSVCKLMTKLNITNYYYYYYYIVTQDTRVYLN